MRRHLDGHPALRDVHDERRGHPLEDGLLLAHLLVRLQDAVVPQLGRQLLEDGVLGEGQGVVQVVVHVPPDALREQVRELTDLAVHRDDVQVPLAGARPAVHLVEQVGDVPDEETAISVKMA